MANRRFIDFPIASTVGDNDIVLIWQDGLNKQTTKGTLIQGAPTSLEGLTDVDIAGLINGQILQYNSVTGKWENVDRTGLNLSELGDVSIVSPSNGQVLVYNSTTSKWENSSAGFVPYVGAVTTVDLGAQGLRAGYVRFNTSVVSVPNEQGLMYWDGDDETIAVILNGYIMKIGEDQFYPVKNQTGSSIAKGTAVRFAGTVGASGRLLIAPFIADGSVSSSFFMGVTAEAIADGADGKVLYFGRIRGINTNAFNEGDVLYASTTVAGGFQTAVPVAPNNIVQVAAVITKSINQGVIFIRPSFGSNINQDEGVKIVSPTTGQLLQLQANGLWENKTTAQVLGGTSSQFVKGDGSLDSTVYVTLDTAQTIIGEKTFRNSIILKNQAAGLNGLVLSSFSPDRLQIGGVTYFSEIIFAATSRSYTLPDASGTIALVGGAGVGTVTSVGLSSATSGVTIGSTPITTSGTITLAIATASGSQNGLLSSTDWTTFNNKQNALTNPVTGTGASGQVAYFTGTSAISSESNLFWDATNDRLGIGTNTFGEKLSVYGSSGVDSFGFFSGGTGSTLGGIKMGNGGNTYGSLYFDNGSNDVTLFQQFISGSLRFGTNSIVKMILTQNGRLLIGNAPPTESTFALDVNGTGRFINAVLGGTGSAFADGLRVNRNSNLNQYTVINHLGGATNIVSVDQTGNNIAEIYFGRSINGSTITNSMVIDKSGNVGIGTDSVTTGKLVVKSGDSNSSGIVLETPVGAGTNKLVNIFSETQDGKITVGSGATTKVFLNSSGASYFTGGNLGVGTATVTTGKFVVKSGESNSTGIVLERSDNTDKLVNIFSTTADGKISIASGATTKIFLDSVGASYFTGGNVLIGTTTNGGYKLQVNGNISISGNNYLDFGNGDSRIVNTGGILSFQTFTIGSFDTRMTITGPGNVLIGTTSDNGSRLRINGSIALPHVTKSANYTLDGTDYTVGFDCASNRTANLPDATTCAGRIYVIYQYNVNSGMRSVTLDGHGSQTINGLTTYSLYPFCENTTITIQSDGANWIIIGSNFTVDCM